MAGKLFPRKGTKHRPWNWLMRAQVVEVEDILVATVEEVRIPLQRATHMLQRAEKAPVEVARVEVVRAAHPEATQKVHPPHLHHEERRLTSKQAVRIQRHHAVQVDFTTAARPQRTTRGQFLRSASDPSSLHHSFSGGRCIMALLVHTTTVSTTPYPPRRITPPTTPPIPFCACARSTINVAVIMRIRRLRRRILHMLWSMGQSMRSLMGL